MPELVSQNDFRILQQLSFCYLCGQEFEPEVERTRDHVPPQAVFAKSDRTPPLILPAHRACNETLSTQDKIIGQLISVLHGKYPSRRDTHLKIDVLQGKQGSEPLAAIRGTGLQGAITRWVKAFHAALYKQPLAKDTRNAIHACPVEKLIGRPMDRA